MSNRYVVSGNAEGLYQPGSDDKVLANKLGIVDPQEMDDVELASLDALLRALLERIEIDQTFTADDLCAWHLEWLAPVYSWAGRYRTVNLEKDGYPFAAANRIHLLMEQYERQVLAVHTPCHQFDEARLLEALAVSHVEFIVIHPFREGNGRISRVLATLMALQAGWPPLDFSRLVENRQEYFAAIQHGHAGNYEPIRQIFSKVLQASQLAG